MVRKLLVKMVELFVVLIMIHSSACLPYEIKEPPESDENYPPIIVNSSHIQGTITDVIEGKINYFAEVLDYNTNEDILSAYWFVYRINDTEKPSQVSTESKNAKSMQKFEFTFDSNEYQCGNYYIIKILISDRGFSDDYGTVPSKEANAKDPIDASKVKTVSGFWYTYFGCE